jgi:pimeloyl-ACP methyl ester carboxylesterase
MLARRIAMTRPQTANGAISQICAGFTHRVTPDKLRQISASIPKVMIITGDSDELVNPRNSFRLKNAMPEAELLVCEGTGHGVQLQDVEGFNETLKRVFYEGIQNARVS